MLQSYKKILQHTHQKLSFCSVPPFFVFGSPFLKPFHPSSALTTSADVLHSVDGAVIG